MAPAALDALSVAGLAPILQCRRGERKLLCNALRAEKHNKKRGAVMHEKTNEAEQAIDLAGFRRALSCFATGVAVVTTLDAAGDKVGMTISSFSSVSLDPPLVLWSIAEDAMSYTVFVEAEYFAVNVLAMHQEELSGRFAQTGTDKFHDLDCRDGLQGVPILPECAACFECRAEHRYEGGDHKIIVGRVLRMEDRETDPLIFYRGRYLRKGGLYPEGT